jgi:glycosyltransferase involved in cell wall biosynthesis
MPKVSVIIPNYNHARFLEQRIESVLNQTFQDFEVILLDDASPDNSLDIINRYHDHPKFTIVINEKNSGSTFLQWKRGVEIAKGEYIWIAESDDVAEPQLLDTLVKHLEESPSIVLAYCQSLTIDSEGNRLGSMCEWTKNIDKDRWHHNFTNNGEDECVNYLILQNTIPNASAVVFRKSSFMKINTTTDLRLSGDWIIWSRLIKQGDIAFCAEHLNLFRQHPQTVRFSTKQALLSKEWILVTKEILSSAKLTKKQKAELGTKLFQCWKQLISPRILLNPKTLYFYVSTLFVISPGKALRFYLHILLKTISSINNRVWKVMFFPKLS